MVRGRAPRKENQNMSKLIPLSSIPYAARAAEREARRAFATRVAALEAAQYRIVVAPGCHSRPYFDPPTVGWVCSREAAEALAAQQTRMPDGTSHSRLRCEA